jgi:KRAB domain-containing zinc finger protein
LFQAQKVLQSLNTDVEHLKVEDEIETKNFQVKLETDEVIEEENYSVEQADFSESFVIEQSSVFEEDQDSDPDFKLIKNEEEEIQCYYCGDMMCQAFIKDHQLDKHGGYCGRMFGKPRTIHCLKCNGTFETDSALGLHNCYDIYIPKKKFGEPYKCEKCSKEFKNRKTFRYHLQTAHTDQKNFQCTQCSYCTKTSSLFNRHIERVHDKLLPHMCPECGKRFYASGGLTKHIRKVHQNTIKGIPPQPVEFKCDKCEASFNLKLGLTKHLESYHGIEPRRDHICEECGKSFSQAAGLQSHIKNEHPSDEDLNKIDCICLVCKKNFNTASDLNQHQIVHHDMVETKTCDRCETRWASVDTLQKHIAETHKIIVFPCELCDKTFRRSYSKDCHVREIHQRSDQFQCPHCSKVFGRKYQVHAHVKSIHEDGGDFKCNFCDFRGCSKSRLQIHVQGSHIKQIRYECDLCKYFTYRKDCLGAHIKTVHDKKKNHKCDLCHLTFFAKRDKNKHMEKHV